MKKMLLFAIIIMLSAVIPTAYAQYPPVDFHQFYGTVTGIGPGAIITAQLSGNTYTTNVDANNRYGYTTFFFVQGVTNNAPITFLINGLSAGTGTYAFQQGSITELNLTYNATTPLPPPPLPPSSGGGGGGGGHSARNWYRNITQPVTPGAGIECFDDWICTEWGPCLETGLQTRTCGLNDYLSCTSALPKPPEEQSCELPPVAIPNCFDGIQNQDETYPDCGGSICKQCDPGLSCRTDYDCVTGYCRPETQLCGWMPVIETPITPPKAETSYWWLWLIILGLLLAATGIGISIYYLEKGMKEATPERMSSDRISEVRQYAHTFLNKGVPKERIEAKLKEAGWKDEDIQEALK